jgi:DNA-binding Lrp family transcriptional regulator
MSKNLDKYDAEILAVLQGNGRITNQKLAEQVNLSTAPCWRRLNRLEQDGYIERYVALVNSEQVGLSVTVYIHVQLHDHDSKTVDQFNQFVEQSDAILECYSVSGEYDYLLRVVAKDVHALEIFLMEKLLKLESVRSANTSFVLKQKKYTTALPLDHN